MSNGLKEKSINSFVWKSAQSVCSLGMTFVIQLILARMLTPEDFGVVAITTVFMTLANTVIETSFSSSIIQRMQLEHNLTSSIFYANLFLSVVVYAALFLLAPYIATFYEESLLTLILRVQGLRIIISGLYSVPQALLNRKMRFKAIFICYFLGSIGQALVGMTMAYAGAGVWALVLSTLASCIVSGAAMIVAEPWKPKLYFSFKLVKDALSFSSNVLAIRVTRKLFYNIRVLAIGRVYDAGVLGLFNKGFQFPSTIMTVVDGSLTSVAFTSLSKIQNDQTKLRSSLRQYVRVMMFICMPLMVGLVMVAELLVTVLLTEKWLGCVPFLQLIAISQLFIPLNVKTTAFEAMGKSRLSMQIHLSSIVMSILLLMISIPFSATLVAFSGIISNLLLQVVITYITSKELQYKIIDQLKDAFCGVIPTIAMAIAVFAIDTIHGSVLIKLCTEILLGALIYIFVSFLTKNHVFYLLLNILQSKMLRRKSCRSEEN